MSGVVPGAEFGSSSAVRHITTAMSAHRKVLDDLRAHLITNDPKSTVGQRLRTHGFSEDDLVKMAMQVNSHRRAMGLEGGLTVDVLRESLTKAGVKIRPSEESE